MSREQLDALLVTESDHFLPSSDPAGRSSFSPLYEYLNEPLRALSLPFHYHLDSPQRCSISYLAGFLGSSGFSCAAADNVLRDPAEAVRFGELLTRRPAVVGISTSSLHKASSVAAIAARVRAVSPSSVIVIGGPGLGFTPAMAEYADVMVEGDGETALAELVGAVKKGTALGELPGLVRGLSAVPVMKGRRDLSLDYLPDWGVCTRRSACFPLETSRGCAHACVFCSYPGRGRQEYRPLEPVLKEIRFLVKDLGARCLRFVDTNLTSDTAWVERLCRALIKEDLRVPWSCFARADELARGPGLCRLMAEAGCCWVYSGVESPDAGILGGMRKGFSPGDIAESVRNVRKAGMAYHANFVIGFPGETEQSVARTRDFIISSGMDTVSFTVLGVTAELAALAGLNPAGYGGLSGEGHGWRHSGMDYARARELTAGIIGEIAACDGAPLIASHGIGVYYLMGGGEDFAGMLAYFAAVRDWHRARARGDSAAAGLELEKVRRIYSRTSAGFAVPVGQP